MQECTAYATIYHTRNGESEDIAEHVGDNSAYWAAKEVGTVTLETGFRVWKNKNDKAVVGAADNGSFQYELADFSE